MDSSTVESPIVEVCLVRRLERCMHCNFVGISCVMVKHFEENHIGELIFMGVVTTAEKAMQTEPITYE